jgi:hypothetical protein
MKSKKRVYRSVAEMVQITKDWASGKENQSERDIAPAEDCHTTANFALPEIKFAHFRLKTNTRTNAKVA